MPESQVNPGSVPVALLHEAGDRGDVLKHALNQYGAAIVYESLAAEFDRAALAGSGARIVVFNLDADSEAQIDDVYDALDEGGYEVVFNDAEASDRLSGTDQARWARHLAAKILHNPEIAEPPRPAWAESVPAPGSRAERLPPAPPAVAVPAVAEPEPTEASPAPELHAASPEPASGFESAPLEASTFEPPSVAAAAPESAPLEAAASEPPSVEATAPESAPLEAAASEPPSVEATAPESAPLEAAASEPPSVEATAPESASIEIAASEPSPLEITEPELPPLDVSEPGFAAGRPEDAVPSIAAETPTQEVPVPEQFNLEETEIDLGASDQIHMGGDFAESLDDFAAQVPVHRPEAAPAEDIAGQLDTLFASAQGAASATGGGEEAEFPAGFDDAAGAAPETADDATEPTASEAAPPAAGMEKASSLLPPDWLLEPLDENTEVTPPAGKGSAFGIETMTATEFMGPDEDRVIAAPSIGDGLGLELVPMEDAVAPGEFASAVPAAAVVEREASEAAPALKVGSGGPLQRVVVLGASIGGPEAIREFLGAVPREFPALFVLAQHMGDEFLELMSSQLAKAVELTVRTPTHGERVGHGEIVIVPTRQRMQIDNEGVITLSPLIERTAYSPSIDQVMHDIADEFGARANAIVFSGMAQDAIEGSKYLQSLGGAVWTQDPDSCTISTMVDSVRQTGAVAFIGTPQQLAEKMIADYGPGD